MAHEINISAAGKAAMAFSGETPWHGLGQRLTEGAPLEVWTREAGMDWEAKTANVVFTRDDGTIGNYGDKRVIYRGDTGAPLSVMGDGYKMVQPRECIHFFESLIEGGDYKLHTAGVLNGGRRMWALARNGATAEIVKGDKVARFLMLATSLDGSTPTVAAFTSVRVVCANTIAIALREAKTGKAGKAVRVSHRSVFDAYSVKAQLGLAATSWAQYVEDMQALSEKRVTLGEARDVLREIFGQPVSNRKKDAAPTSAFVVDAGKAATIDAAGELAALLAGSHVPKADAADEARDDLARILAGGNEREQKSVKRSLELFAGAARGANHPGVKGTAWGLLNAVTEHIDHEQGRTRDTGLSNAWFGKGADAKQETLAALLAL